MSIKEISKLFESAFINHESNIQYLCIDSRNILFPTQALYFAIKGSVNDGHHYIDKVYDQGVRNFVVSDANYLKKFDDVNYIISKNPVDTLQQIAISHREKFNSIKTVAITGSNGKTIVKEWLSIVLSKKYNVVKSPKSYNSQIGVPLSVWQINEDHEIGIFEAGISKNSEMTALEKIIQPQIGIFTNIGDAHGEGFDNIEEKLNEKLLLYKNCEAIIFCGDNDMIYDIMLKKFSDKKLLSWGFKNRNAIKILDNKTLEQKTWLELEIDHSIHQFQFNLVTDAIFENVMQCIVASNYLGISDRDIESGLSHLANPDMRLNITEGKDGVLIVNDTYTLDLNALKIAIDFTFKHGVNRKKYLILSEEDNPMNNDKIIDHIKSYDFEKIFLVGKSWKYSDDKISIFNSTENLISIVSEIDFEQGIILIKGARVHSLEKVVESLSLQKHSASLDIDLNAIEHNLSTFATLIKSNAEIIPIIKASAYGSGSDEIAKILQHKGIKMLGVAFADEGVRLRKAGIVIPIIVLNPDENSYVPLSDYNLDFEVYSIHQLKSVINWRNGKLKTNRIHIKLDTGMSRLGFQQDDIPHLQNIIKENSLKIGSVFSHLSSSEDMGDDDFSHLQAKRFLEMYHEITSVLNYKPMRHILNSSGIIRFPEYHFEAVRLGIGLYGIDSTASLASKIEKVHTLKARVIQIKKVKTGHYIGYNRKHKAESNMTIGILNIGYADGFIRLCGNSRYEVLIRNTKIKVIGNICMDLSIVDLTNHHHIEVGDEVIIFGKNHPIEEMAKVCHTIPYEILCRVAPRVKRNYVY